MTMEYKSNYEKVTEDWKKRFLDMDQELSLIHICVVRASIPRTERPFMKNEKRKKDARSEHTD